MSSPATALTPDFVLAYRELILSTIAGESKTTRKVIASVPEVSKDWRPDRLSRTARELAWHLAFEEVMFLDKIADMKIAMTESPAPPATIAEILQYYEEKLPPALGRVRDMTAKQLLTPVPFFGLVTEPVFRYLMLINNHSIHHRGQLSSYLRSMGSKVPSIYGPSADEK
jgi:uncharacterized damage-inducible protein DinB